jgi:hypothetical protein
MGMLFSNRAKLVPFGYYNGNTPPLSNRLRLDNINKNALQLRKRHFHKRKAFMP